MDKTFTILFFYDGESRSITVKLEKPPKDKIEAETAAWGAVRTWFEIRCIKIPDFVHNVRFDDIEEYSWDILSMPSSIEQYK